MTKKKKADDLAALKARDRQVYRLKISLAGVHPPIWRRLEVYAGMEMDSVAAAIDAVFGWSGDHMGEFDIKGRRIGDGTDWCLEDRHAAENELRRIRKRARSPLANEQKAQSALELLSSLKAKLQEQSAPAEAAGDSNVPALWELVPRVRTKFIYIYDFGDDWEHVIEVEKILAPEAGVRYPRCTDGARADPIEDCGGVWGYEELVEAAGNPKHERYADLEDWGLEKWNPEQFSTEETDRKLAKVFRRK